MPALAAPIRRQQPWRIPTILVAARHLGIDERTFRRWIDQRPELRPVLRVDRHGRQWHVHLPESWAELEQYKRDVESAVTSFRRLRKKSWERPDTAMKNNVVTALGFGNEKRERGLLVLRAATELKLANAKPTSVFKAQSMLAEKIRSDRTSRWVGTVRIIAKKYGCEVKDVLNYLDRWIADENVARRTYWQKRTKMTLVYDNKRSVEIDPKRELQRELRELKNNARRIGQSWPSPQQWDKAEEQVKSQWLWRTLIEAARELADKGERINGANLAPLLFLNEYREHHWKTNEKLKQLKQVGESVMLDSYGRRGISLRLFRDRHDRMDIKEAKRIAEGTTASEEMARRDKAAKEGKDENGFGHQLITKRGDSIAHAGDVSCAAARAIRATERIIRETKDPKQRQALEEYLRRLKREEG